ncbi:uncharacterized protein LOC130676989 [Microplitis mediator]|uniref:uncharacterized protein LOC130676989 n=1 Tax=Microplitis mediator TaxID=375433 RepID=UPI0025528FAA|nr:uncharacterized protein LOC130676989 [Microplitis mediator]
MPNKNEQTYSDVLEILKKRATVDFNPRRIMIDYGTAFINAVSLHFPDAEIAGCFFHFSQCVWRHVQSTGLQKLYNTNIRFALNVRMLMALAFVPAKDVHNAFDELIRSTFYDENEEVLEPLISYVERTWIGVCSRSGKRRLKAYYSLDL